MLTYQDVRRLFNYNENTGVLSWKEGMRRCRRLDRVAGSLLHPGRGLVFRTDHKNYFVHRVIWLWMTGEWPKKGIDHINRIPTDNRFCNLRDVSQTVNMYNTAAKGYCWYKPTRCWTAHIQFHGKNRNLGYFKTELAAAYAHHVACVKNVEEELAAVRENRPVVVPTYISQHLFRKAKGAFETPSGTWHARFKDKHLGNYKTYEEANAVYTKTRANAVEQARKEIA